MSAALDVERLAAAIHNWRQCDFGYCEGYEDHLPEAQGVADEYADGPSVDSAHQVDNFSSLPLDKATLA